MSMKKHTALYIIFFFLSTPVFALDYDVVLRGGVTHRFNDTFDSLMGNYRSNYFYNGLRSAAHEPMKNPGLGELSLGVYGLLGENTRLGLSLGSYQFDGGQTEEIRENPGFFHATWTFSASYFLFTYHSQFESFRLGSLGHWVPELGGGFGFIPEFVWRGNGWNYQEGRLVGFSSYQRSAMPMLLMLEGAISRPVTRLLRFRLGLRLQYAHISGLKGTVNGGNGSFYRLDDSSVTPVTENTLSFLPPESVTGNATYGRAGATTGIQERVSLSLSNMVLTAGFTVSVRSIH